MQNNNWFWHLDEPQRYKDMRSLMDDCTLTACELADVLHIPEGTVTNWYWGCSKTHKFVLDLIAYYIINEQYIIDPTLYDVPVPTSPNFMHVLDINPLDRHHYDTFGDLVANSTLSSFAIARMIHVSTLTVKKWLDNSPRQVKPYVLDLIAYFLHRECYMKDSDIPDNRFSIDNIGMYYPLRVYHNQISTKPRP